MNRRSAWMAMFMTVLLLAGCGGGGGGSSSGGGGIGTLSVSLADATTDRFSAVYITITEVQVHQPGTSEGDQRNWRPVRMPRTPMTVNLLDLVNGVLEELGNVQLAAGTYTQMRLIIGAAPEPGAVNILNQPHPYANYVMDRSTPPNSYELKVPSGSQSGYKVVGGFDIIANSTTELILDFDADRSVVEAGNSGQWLLKPTVKIVYDYAIIEGLVTTTSGSTSTPLPGVRVSAQMFDGVRIPASRSRSKQPPVPTIAAAIRCSSDPDPITW